MSSDPGALTASGSDDMVLGSRHGPQNPELGMTRLTSGGAGIGAKRRGEEEEEEEGKKRKQRRKKQEVRSCSFVKI